VAELYGKLANIFADLPNRRLVTSSMFKTLVSGDPITAERKHQHPFSFRNYAKLLFSANELPGTNDRTYAFYRRWLIIPFERTFNGADGNPAPDHQLRAKLKQELSGILNYALLGLHRLTARGEFTETPHTLAAKQRYMHANDSVQAFIEECVTLDKDATVSKREFWDVYRSWCDMLHKRLVSQTKLKEALYTAVPGLDEARPSRSAPWQWLGMTLNEAAQTYRLYTRGEGGASGQEPDAPF
jgi:putative DNA primase/helicase